jgi:DNA-directed RNA polymerase subunit H
MKKKTSLEEKRAKIILKYRGLKVEKREERDDLIVYHLSRGDKNYILHILLGKDTIGVSYVRELREELEQEEAANGIIVGEGKYTYSARSNAPKMDIELIPSIIPTFDVFEHQIVPRHEIVTESERQELIEKYHAEPYQFPWIKSSDPISIILGARPGDVLRIIQKSETAGMSESYRYVV